MSTDNRPAAGADRWGPPDDAQGPAADDSTTTGPLRITSTANTPRQDVGRHAAPEDAADRGALEIADVVAEKVAIAAATEIEHVGGAARRVLGVPTGRDTTAVRPQASARVSGQVAALELRLSVTYPASVRATTEAVRAHVRDRVHALTELTVSRVDITVAGLTGPGGPSTKRVDS